MGCFNGFGNWSTGRITHVKFEHNQILRWHDLKNREVSAKPIIHNRLGWKFDVFHAMGCYLAAEKGLYRSQQEIDKGMQYSMFPELKKVAQRSASKKIQTVMQKNLPPDTPIACGGEVNYW